MDMAMIETDKTGLLENLAFVYGEEKAPDILRRLEAILAEHWAAGRTDAGRKPFFDETDVVAIAYGDHIREDGKPPLRTLHEFMAEHMKGLVSGIHILPFYPYTSDDGFSVVDYYAVNPELGSWEDVKAVASDFELMFDAVTYRPAANGSNAICRGIRSTGAISSRRTPTRTILPLPVPARCRF